VQLLSHYVGSLPPGSPHRNTYAAPTAANSSLLPAAGLALLGVIALVSGAILAGLATVAAGIGWGMLIHKRAEAAGKARATWENRRICLACTEQWTP
jgi:hypothetical protein